MTLYGASEFALLVDPALGFLRKGRSRVSVLTSLQLLSHFWGRLGPSVSTGWYSSVLCWRALGRDLHGAHCSSGALVEMRFWPGGVIAAGPWTTCEQRGHAVLVP